MRKFNTILVSLFFTTILTIAFQNCGVPFESSFKIDQQSTSSITNSNNQITDDDSNHSSQFPIDNVPIPSPNTPSFNLPSSGPVFYIFQTLVSAMVKDLCLSDSNYAFKLRNSGSNPKLCLTKYSNFSACSNNIGNFVSLSQAGYQKIGTDWMLTDNGYSLRQLILPSQAPISLAVFYIDDDNQTPKQVGGFNVHACADKIMYNHISFTCPNEDICERYFPEMTMEKESCILTTGGVKISCIPKFVEAGSPKSGTFAKFPEPKLSQNANSGGETTVGIVSPPPNTGNNTGSDTTFPNNGTCQNNPKSTTIVTWTHYNNPGTVLETKTIAQGTARAFQFTANKSIYPQGQQIQFETTTYAGGSNRMDFTISPCPGVFESSQKRCSFTKIKVTSILTGFNPSDATKCILEDGKQYYLNIRPSQGYIDVAKVVGSQRL